MTDLRHLIFEKERIGKALEVLQKPGPSLPAGDPERSLLLGHALFQYGDLQKARKIYSSIPSAPAYEAERLWGLGNALYKSGELEQAKTLFDQVLTLNPAAWLLPRLYHSLGSLYILEGQFGLAREAFDSGLEVAAEDPHGTASWILETGLGAVHIHTGSCEEGIFLLQKAARQLLARDAALSAGHCLVTLAWAFCNLSDTAEAGKYLSRAEGLVEESGSVARLIHLRIIQGCYWRGSGRPDKAEQVYQEAGELLQSHPIPESEISLNSNLADLLFEKGQVKEALRLVRKARDQVQEKGLHYYEEYCFFSEGSYLLRAGAIPEALVSLHRAFELAQSRGRCSLVSLIALYLALGYEESKNRAEALRWLQESFAAAQRSSCPCTLHEESDILVPLLLKMGEDLPLTEFLSQLIVRLHQPSLVKRLLRHSPEGKILFLRSLRVHEARPYRRELERLRNDPVKEVRRSARLLQQGWSQHVGYRVYALGTLRVFREGMIFTDTDWTRPGVKRLFLYLATHPNEWLPTESLIEALWGEAPPGEPQKVLYSLFYYLRNAFEPWHSPRRPYALLQSQRGAYGFFPATRVWMDWEDFLEGVRRAENVLLVRNFKEARKAFRESLGLYLGDLLEEFPYEDWLRGKRDYLREVYFRSVQRYASLERESGNLHEARRVLEEALFRDPSRSECAVLEMQVLSQMKLSQQAREWGQRHLKYVAEELKSQPAPEVLEVFSKLP